MRSVPWLKQVLGLLFDAPSALAFGVAALCLLAPGLDCSERFGTNLRVLVLLAGLSVGSFAVAGLWNEGCGEGAVPLLFLPGLAALDVAAAIAMTGLAHRYCRPVWLILLFPVLVSAISVAVAVPVYFVTQAVCPLPLGTLGRLVIPIAVFLSLGIQVTLLPFLVLFLASPLFRGRIKVLFYPARQSSQVL